MNVERYRLREIELYRQWDKERRDKRWHSSRQWRIALNAQANLRSSPREAKTYRKVIADSLRELRRKGGTFRKSAVALLLHLKGN